MGVERHVYLFEDAHLPTDKHAVFTKESAVDKISTNSDFGEKTLPDNNVKLDKLSQACTYICMETPR